MAALTVSPPGAITRVRAAVASEWIKLRSVRSTKIVSALALVLTVIVGVGTCAGYRHAWTGMTAAQRASFDPAAASLNGLQLATILFSIIGVLCISSEYGSGMIRSTFLATPQRGLVLAAKAVPFTLVTWLAATVIAFATFLAGQSLLASPVPHATLGQPGVLRAVLGAGLAVALTGLLGLGLGTVLRSTAVTTGVLFILLFILPGIASALPASLRHQVTPYLPSEAGHAMFVVVRDPAFELSPGGGLAVLAGYATVALIAAAILIRRRDA